MMSISLKKISARMLSLAAGCALAGILAACGGDGFAGGSPSPSLPVLPIPIPVPVPTLTYDVVPLSLGGPGYRELVLRKGITTDGKFIAGTVDVAKGLRHAFRYDGANMIDLGTMGGMESEAAGVNQLGQVVGKIRFEDGSIRAFLYDGTMHDLGTLGGANSWATDINDRGQVTGSAAGADGIVHAFLYENGTMKQLKTPAGLAGSSTGELINASGVVAGTYVATDGSTRSFLATASACNCPKDVGGLGGDRTIVYAFNDAGQLAGVASDAAGNVQRAFLYENGAIKDLGTLGGTFALASAMNQAGQVIGFAGTANGDSHVFMYDGQLLRDLGTLPGGTSFQAPPAINATGLVVGEASIDLGRAFKWTADGGMVDLNTVLHNPPAGLVLERAFAVSDNGMIVAGANQGLFLLKAHQGN